MFHFCDVMFQICVTTSAASVKHGFSPTVSVSVTIFSSFSWESWESWWSFDEQDDSFFKWSDFKNFGPEIAIARAPIGAVIIMDNTAIVRTVNPRGFNVSFLSFIAWSNANPPIAACGHKNINVSLQFNSFPIVIYISRKYHSTLYFTCTVAFGIHASDTNICSLRFKPDLSTAKNVTEHRTSKPEARTATPNPRKGRHYL